MIASLFRAGNARAAFVHRFAQCTRATDCGRLCERLVKAPGKALVYCVDPETGQTRQLYPALEDPAFTCPLGRF